MTKPMMDLRALMEKSADAVLLREMIAFAAERLMELVVGARTGADHARKTATAWRSAMACLVTSLGFLAIREPLPGTPNMPGSGGGRIENGSAVAGRAVVCSPPSFLMT